MMYLAFKLQFCSFLSLWHRTNYLYPQKSSFLLWKKEMILLPRGVIRGPYPPNKAQCLVSLLVLGSNILLTWVCNCSPFTKRPKEPLVLNEAQNKIRPCKRSILRCLRCWWHVEIQGPVGESQCRHMEFGNKALLSSVGSYSFPYYLKAEDSNETFPKWEWCKAKKQLS